MSKKFSWMKSSLLGSSTMPMGTGGGAAFPHVHVHGPHCNHDHDHHVHGPACADGEEGHVHDENCGHAGSRKDA